MKLLQTRWRSMRGRAWLFACLFTTILHASDAPAWLLRASRQATPAGAGDAPAAILLDETVMTIDANGVATTEHHVAKRILNHTGSKQAYGIVYYLDKSDKVRDADAWLLRGGRVITPADSKKWYDVAEETPGAIYDESRAKEIFYSDLAVPGDIFAYSSTVTGHLLVCQERFAWGHSFPVVAQRTIVRLPHGWDLAAVTKGPVTPVLTVSPDRLTHTWELTDRPYRPEENWTAPAGKTEAELLLTFLPSKDSTAAPVTFQNWHDVEAYQEHLTSGQCDSDASLVAKVAGLTNGCPDNLAKIRALGSSVQQLRYVGINRDLRLGFGYRPRKATEVLAKGFGDCKDKANLLCALLREAGIRSHPVIAQSTDEGDAEIFPDWPSPYQFNHMILAIEVDPKTDLPAVIPTRQWGSLLFFDPTNPETELGDLPWYLQGTLVEVLAPESDELIRLPDLPVEQNRVIERRLKLVLNASGVVIGEGSIVGTGQKGADWRRRIHESTAKELNDSITQFLGAELRGVVVQKVTPIEESKTGRAGISVTFAAPNFVQPLSGGLAIVRLNPLTHDSPSSIFTQKERRTDVLTQPQMQRDEVTCTLPSIYQVDELPKPESFQTAYGSYERTYEVKPDGIVARRVFKLNRLTVPAAEYSAFRKFLSDVAKSDRSAVVLRRGT